MKQLEKKDLIKDEIYKHENGNLVKYQFDGDINGKIKGSYIGHNADYFSRDPISNFTISSLILATQEEKYWLEECIKVDEFITFEEAMKTFIKYYKIIENRIGGNYNSNVIYKRNTVFGHYNGNYRIIKAIEIGKTHFNSTFDVVYGEIGEKKVCFNMEALQPSTKEAYDAQFVVKEPKFMLPEKWYVRRNKENYIIINRYFKTTYINEHYPISEEGIIGTNGKTWFSLFDNNQYAEITFEQFKKYVLKEQLEEPKDKVLLNRANSNHNSQTLTISKVESSEGAIYQLGDKITVFTKDSPNKGKVFTIKGFRWNNAKTNICAITELHTPNGIGLDKIELYSEPVVKELSLLEQAKLKYPIGTKVTNYNLRLNCKFTIDSKNFKYYSKTEIIVRTVSGNGAYTVYKNGKWAEIIEDFKLPETWWITIENERQLKIAKQYFGQHLNSVCRLSIGNTVGFVKSTYLLQSLFLTTILSPTKKTNPQITFEQFEQYVLHNGFKVGDIINNGNWIIYDLKYIDGHSVAFYKYAGSDNTNTQCRILTKNIVR